MNEKKIILVMGIRGTGKSTQARKLLSTRSRILIYDTLNEYTEGVIIQDMASLCEVWQKVHDKKFKIIYQPISPLDDFSTVCELVYTCGDMTFCVEEIDTFLSFSPQGLDFNFLNIVQRGRHKAIELIGITQRPYSIPAIVRSQCKELYTFKQFEQRDIDWLKGILGDEAEKVKELEQFEYISFIDGNINQGKTEKI